MRQQGWIAMNTVSSLAFHVARHVRRLVIPIATVAGLLVLVAIAVASIGGPLPPASEELLTAAPFRW